MNVKMLDTSACPGPLGIAAWRLQAGKRIREALSWMTVSVSARGNRGGGASAMARRMDREQAAKRLDARVLRDIGLYEEERVTGGADNAAKEE